MGPSSERAWQPRNYTWAYSAVMRNHKHQSEHNLRTRGSLGMGDWVGKYTLSNCVCYVGNQKGCSCIGTLTCLLQSQLSNISYMNFKVPSSCSRLSLSERVESPLAFLSLADAFEFYWHNPREEKRVLTWLTLSAYHRREHPTLTPVHESLVPTCWWQWVFLINL